MLYTPSHAELGQHPKTRKLARKLGVSIPTAIGHLHLLWHFALKYAPDGDLARFDNDELADGCMWEGDSGDLYEGLRAAEWINADATLHDWHEYGGKYIKQKEDNAERQQRWRDRNKTGTQQSPNTLVTVTSPLSNALEESKEEKNRGEKRKEEDRGSVRRPPAPQPLAAAPTPAPKATTRAKGATPAPDSFPISDDMRAWADEHAPGVDVDRETDRFLDRNRASGTTYKDWAAAWRNWLTSPYAKPQQLHPNGRAPDLASVNGVAMSPRMARNLRVLQETEL